VLERVLPLNDADIVFYLAGADPYCGDRLGRLSLSKDGLATRDAMVIRACRRLNKPVVVTMAGGYAKDIADTVAIQAATVQIAKLALRNGKQ
jgi:acetoin utilization deacetylase AcuC-like enzyme